MNHEWGRVANRKKIAAGHSHFENIRNSWDIMAFFKKILKKNEKESDGQKEKGDEEKKVAGSVATAREKKEKSGYNPGILISPHITEKSTVGNALNTYVFKVRQSANKPEVKKAVEGKYGVRVSRVRIVNTKPRKVRLGRSEGVVPGYKKAMVTLMPGDKIEFGV